MAFWCKFFMSVLMLDFGNLSLSYCSMECSWMAPLTPAVIMMRGLVFHPLWCMLFISESYLVCLCVLTCSRNLLWQYVNSMNCTMWFGEGDIGVCIWLGPLSIHRMSGLNLGGIGKVVVGMCIWGVLGLVVWVTSIAQIHQLDDFQKVGCAHVSLIYLHYKETMPKLKKNMSESRCDKWQKIDRFVTLDNTVNSDIIFNFLSLWTIIYQFHVIYYVFIRTCFCQFDHCFLVVLICSAFEMTLPTNTHDPKRPTPNASKVAMHHLTLAECYVSFGFNLSMKNYHQMSGFSLTKQHLNKYKQLYMSPPYCHSMRRRRPHLSRWASSIQSWMDEP